jgi:hypothetical protein
VLLLVHHNNSNVASSSAHRPVYEVYAKYIFEKNINKH